jgi:hypothetical protein
VSAIERIEISGDMPHIGPGFPGATVGKVLPDHHADPGSVGTVMKTKAESGRLKN